MDHHVLKDKVLLAVLSDVPFDRWSWGGVLHAAQNIDIPHDNTRAVFPDGLGDVLSHFADYLDREMLKTLDNSALQNQGTTDTIAAACMARYKAMNDYREQERLALQYWMRPMRKYKAAKIVWRTADIIWTYAGDTSTDYNHYTKRALLSGVLVSTTLAWLDDESKNLGQTRAFLDRRLDNVLKIGKPVGMILSKLKRT